MISKPSGLDVPPWQMVSALRATLRSEPRRGGPSHGFRRQQATTAIKCWDEDILKTKKPGPVAIAKTGSWDELEINLRAPLNHAKIGTAIADDKKYAMFGDINQQGAPRRRVQQDQNGRGGLFFVVRTTSCSRASRN